MASAVTKPDMSDETNPPSNPKNPHTTEIKLNNQMLDFFAKIPKFLDEVIETWNSFTEDKLYFSWDCVRSGPNVFYGQCDQPTLVVDYIPTCMMTPYGKISFTTGGVTSSKWKTITEQMADKLKLDLQWVDGAAHLTSIAWPSCKHIPYTKVYDYFYPLKEAWSSIWSDLVKETKRSICRCSDYTHYEWKSTDAPSPPSTLN